MTEIIDKQQPEIVELQREVKRLGDQLRLNSCNSSYPPSTDKNRTGSEKKVNNLQKSTTKKTGGRENKNRQKELCEALVRPAGFEPSACGLGDRRS
ncbi:MAG TPA: DUF6444 domain-containing protein, partial [Candidatus Atribacteria bacterium]|nr:DUF6444 domain-containing protein [Candidatus Atribacteria bacterium]